MVLQKIDPGDESGQVLALGAMSMLVLALMLMLSFNLSLAIHNKIQLQQESDAQAYSMAVVEARTFNYIAFSNRAIAADLVAMATMHAYMSMLSSQVDAFRAGMVNLFVIAGWEFFLCCLCQPYCCAFQHCIHGILAIEAAFRMDNAKRKYGSKVKKLGKLFNAAIESLSVSIATIHGSQLWMLFYTGYKVLMGSALDKIRTYNSPQSTKIPAAVGALNVENLLCAVEGTPLDSLCFKHKAAGAKKRGQLLTEIANASRPKWTTDRTLVDMLAEMVTVDWGPDIGRRIQGSGLSFPVSHTGTAKLTPSTSGVGSGSEGQVGNDVGARDHGYLFTWFHDGVWASGYTGDIYSDKNGGKHDPSAAHGPSHNKYKGDANNVGNSKGCLMVGDCFVKFRADKDVKHAYGQPMVYDYTTRDLSVQRSGKHGPWELNKDGRVEIKWGKQKGSVTLRAGKGAAVSKAMVYYHRIGDWRDPPNFFSPYWRAKLQPFTSTEAAEVLTAAGNIGAAEIAITPGTPVE